MNEQLTKEERLEIFLKRNPKWFVRKIKINPKDKTPEMLEEERVNKEMERKKRKGVSNRRYVNGVRNKKLIESIKIELENKIPLNEILKKLKITRETYRYRVRSGGLLDLHYAYNRKNNKWD